MERLFWFSLLLTYLPVTESMENADSCLSQPDMVYFEKTGQSVTLPCSVSSLCSADDWEYEWFSFKENSHIRIKPLDNPQKYTLVKASLHIQSLQANDSGIYHCAALPRGVPAQGTQHIGFGTTLVVRERSKMWLWLSFVLLAIYSLVIGILIIKKYGRRKKPKTEKTKTSTQKTQFHDVLQEMYLKRNFERSKQTVSTNVSEVEVGNADNNTSSGDIYQNV